MTYDTIESISPQTLEIIGDAAFTAIKNILKEKGYNFTGGVSGGTTYMMTFKRDTMDIMGYEKPITLKIELPYPTEERRQHHEKSVTYSSLPEPERDYKENELVEISG